MKSMTQYGCLTEKQSWMWFYDYQNKRWTIYKQNMRTGKPKGKVHHYRSIADLKSNHPQLKFTVEFEEQWHCDGSPKRIQECLDGVRDGWYVEYYPSGKIAERGHYKDGKRHGKQYKYSEGSRHMYSVSEYDNGTHLHDEFVLATWSEEGIHF